MQWYIKIDRVNTQGPYTEAQIQRGLQSGVIPLSAVIRQGSSPWVTASRIRDLFETLTKNGFYLKFTEEAEVQGPFTQRRVRDLEEAGELPDVYWIRHRLDGDWCEINNRPSKHERGSIHPTSSATTSRPLPVPPNSEQLDTGTSPPPAATAPAAIVRPIVVSAPVMKLRRSQWSMLWTSFCEGLTLFFGGIGVSGDDDPSLSKQP